MKNPASQFYRFTVIRLSDSAERFTDRRPAPATLRNLDRMVWDNLNNCEVEPRRA